MAFCDVPGARLHYQEVVHHLGPVTQLLVCVNGYQRPGSDFLAFAKRATQGLPGLCCVFFDNRGVGLTEEEGPTPLPIDLLAQDAHALANHRAQHYGLGGYWALGISMGGMVVQALPTVAQEKGGAAPQGLVLVSTTPGGDLRVFAPGDTQGARRPYKPFPQDLEGLKVTMSKYFGPAFLASSPMAIEAMARSLLRAQKGGSTGNPAPDSGGPRQFQGAMGFDGAPFHSLCRPLPSFVVSGDQDRIIPKENSYVLAQAIGAQWLRVYRGAGHLLLMEKPIDFAKDVVEFLQTL